MSFLPDGVDTTGRAAGQRPAGAGERRRDVVSEVAWEVRRQYGVGREGGQATTTFDVIDMVDVNDRVDVIDIVDVIDMVDASTRDTRRQRDNARRAGSPGASRDPCR